MQTLSYEQMIYSPAWGTDYACKVYTLEGYCKKESLGVDDMVKRALRNGEDFAGTMSLGTTITNNPAYNEREKALRDAATPVNDGETVRIEGRLYTVKLVQKDAADPIHFIRIKDLNVDSDFFVIDGEWSRDECGHTYALVYAKGTDGITEIYAKAIGCTGNMAMARADRMAKALNARLYQ